MGTPSRTVVDYLRAILTNPEFEGLCDAELLRRFVHHGPPCFEIEPQVFSMEATNP